VIDPHALDPVDEVGETPERFAAGADDGVAQGPGIEIDAAQAGARGGRARDRVQDHQSLDAEMMLTAQRTWHFVKVVRWREGALSSAGRLTACHARRYVLRR
jgi:hypothetical protein